MIPSISLEKCKAFIDSQVAAGHPGGEAHLGVNARPTITFSRLTGSGAFTIAECLAAYLQANELNNPIPWTIFDKNLVEKVLEDHHLPARLAQYMPERKISELDDAVGELLGLHPSSWTLVEHITDTIWRLAKLGNVILVGRGATVITAKLPNAFRVRVIGSLCRRAEHTAEFFRLDAKQALAMVDHEDKERARYLHKYFGRQIDDPLLYHLTINTDVVPYEEAARLIGNAVLDHFHLPRRTSSSDAAPSPATP